MFPSEGATPFFAASAKRKATGKDAERTGFSADEKRRDAASTIVIVGSDDVAVTIKLKVLEVCESGLVIETVHVPPSLALLN